MLHPSARFLLFVLVLGCEVDKEDATDEGGTDLTDTGSGGTDTGEADSGVTDTGDDSKEDGPEDVGGVDPDSGETDPSDADTTDITFLLEGDLDQAAISLAWIDITGDDLVVGELLTTASVDGPKQTVGMPHPDEGDLLPLEGMEEVKYSYYLPWVHEDADADGAWDEGEAVRSVGDTWLVYFKNVSPEFSLYTGFNEGWNANKMDLAGTGEGGLIDLGEVPVDLLLTTNDSLAISGSYTASYDIDSLGLALLPVVALEGGEVASFTYEDHLNDPWSITLDGPPDDDHFAEEDTFGSLAVEIPLIWLDTNDSGTMQPTETAASGICVDETPLMLFYLPAIDDPLAAMMYALMGFDLGWSAYIDNDDEAMAVPPELLTGLVIDGDCPL